jgi:hypothetical protein
MSFLRRWFGGGDDEADDTEDASPSAASPATGRSKPLDDFGIDADEVSAEYVNDNEVLITAPKLDGDGIEAYAGEWPRSMMEHAADDPRQPTWVGYQGARNPVEGVREVPLLNEQLNKHIGIFGASGFGKSTLLLNMMVQWAYGGYGFTFIDPKGDDAYKLLQMLPEERIDDVYWLEPGSLTHDEIIGINFLHTHAAPHDAKFDAEASSVEDDLLDILSSSRGGGWGPAMDSIVKNLIRRMLADQERNYTILDIYTLLSNDDYREELPDYYPADSRLRPYAEQIAAMDPKEIQPLLRRLQDFAEMKTLREAVSHRVSDIDVRQLIDDDKIIILRMRADMNDDLVKMVGTSVIRRVWSAVASREDANEDNLYFLVADEFHRLKGGANNVEDMLATGRSLGMSITLATQQPSQLDDLKDSLGNIKNFISFNPGDMKDARFIASRLGTDASNLAELDQYKVYVNLRVSSDRQTGPVRVNTFAPYPFRRSREQVLELIGEIVRKHGSVPTEEDGRTLDAHPLKGTSPGGSDEDGPKQIIVTDDGRTLPEDELLECVFDAQLVVGDGDPDVWADIDAISDQVGRRLGTDINADYGAKLGRAIVENVNDAYLEKSVEDGASFFSLTPYGRDKVFAIDSGESGSAGKAMHRILLERTYLTFRRLGYDVDIPRQKDAMPDGYATPPINPNEDGISYKKAQQRDVDLQGSYPELYEFFGSDELHLEPECQSLTKMKQVLKNLAKAVHAGKHCVFVVAEGDGDDFEANARKIDEAIRERKCVKSIENGNRTFYNMNRKFTFPDGSVACMQKDGNQTWKEQWGDIILENPEAGSEPHVTFKDVDHFENYSKGDFPYFYKRNHSKGQTELYRGDGTLMRAFPSKKELLDDDKVVVRQPFLPESELPGWPFDETWDGYSIVILPDTKTDRGPQLYRDGECRSLFPDNTDVYDVGVDEIEVRDDPEPTTPETATKAHFQDDDEEPMVAGERKPSTNEVVQRSGETWTKPQPGDDDYDPTKDGKNFAHSHKHGNAGSWDGGDARDDDDGTMKGYKTPAEKRAERDAAQAAEDAATDDRDTLGEAAVEGMMDNEGQPPEFRDDRTSPHEPDTDATSEDDRPADENHSHDDSDDEDSTEETTTDNDSDDEEDEEEDDFENFRL